MENIVNYINHLATLSMDRRVTDDSINNRDSEKYGPRQRAVPWALRRVPIAFRSSLPTSVTDLMRETRAAGDRGEGGGSR